MPCETNASALNRSNGYISI